ncbi:uncharacterized protein LOC129794995 [Lutzomyia longipalpis]|uniref:uncharacterized protein LOC129794995 n=1 Tax=Lutzomyia longipalpis TaxID=7200 RepID=UPI0024843AF4|nr:uncharacterized protein LOC129794995 [Lutzomyia longipalpis]
MTDRDVPCVVRRRRKMNRQHYEQLAEGSRLGHKCSSDDDEMPAKEEVKGHREAPHQGSISSYRSKILGRRDRKVANTRSQSTSRVDPINSTNEVASLMRTARRSLSSPRHKDDEMTISPNGDGRSPQRTDSLSITTGKSTSSSKVQENLKKFEEERKRLEKERRKFEQEKHDMDRLRVRRLEEFDRRRITEGYNTFKSQIPRLNAKRGSDEKQSLIENFNRAQKLSNENKVEEKPERLLEKSPSPRTVEEKEEKRSQTPQRSASLREPNRKASIEPADFESSTVSCSTTEEDVGDETEDDPRSAARNRFSSKKPKGDLAPNGVHEVAPKDKDSPEVKNKIPTGRKLAMKELWKEFKLAKRDELEKMRLLRNRCFSNLIILIIFCGIGGIIFRFVEGAFENFYKCGVKRVKRDFVDQLWLSSHSLREEDWKALARSRLRKFEEELHMAHEAGMTSYSGQKAWSFLNGWAYCLTVVTTIGYGHISPTTTTGRAITIVYAVIGIPIFLILLADFGKLFTRGIKFLWSYVRRLYYTGSCRKVRKQAQVQDMMRGINMAYEIATFRRPSAFAKDEEDGKGVQDGTTTTGLHLSPSQQDIGTPQTPMPSEIEIDDEFNLPISLAFFILITYILIGASIYSMWEEWSFFESFYFVFISMSTIGFGDFVPNHPMYMMASIVYLMFGLSLTSMCINVVQVKLSDSFKHASAKIGATIGLKMAEEASLKNSQNGSPVDLASVHSLHSTSPKIEISGTDTQSAADS